MLLEHYLGHNEDDTNSDEDDRLTVKVLEFSGVRRRFRRESLSEESELFAEIGGDLV